MLDAEFAGRLIVTIYSLPDQCYFLVSLICILRVDFNNLQNYSLHSFSPSTLVDFRKEKEENVCLQATINANIMFGLSKDFVGHSPL